jgi:putative transposase
MVTLRVRLKPTKEQERLFWWYSKVARNYFNLLVSADKKNLEGRYDAVLTSDTYHSDYFDRDIHILFQTDYTYLAAKEAINEDWFNKPNQSFIYTAVARELLGVKKRNKGKLRYRSCDKATPRFPVRCDISSNKKRVSRIYVKGNKVVIPSIGDVCYSKSHLPIDLNCKKQTAYIVFDGKYWFLNMTCPCTRVSSNNVSSEALGVDAGIKEFATVSDGRQFANIKNLHRFKVLNRRLKRLQRQLSRKYLINKATKQTKTNNIKKLERKINLIYRSIKNLRLNNIRECIAALTKNKPQYIAIENLNVRGMLKNKHLAREIQNASFYTFRCLLTQRCSDYKIPLHIVNRFYPSSKLCSNCGAKKNLKLSERVYICSACGFICDRDLNAALNLRDTVDFELV